MLCYGSPLVASRDRWSAQGQSDGGAKVGKDSQHASVVSLGR